MKSSKGLGLFILALLIVSMALSRNRVGNSSSVTMLVTPTITTVSVGENLTVGIYIENVIDLFGWQAVLTWNPSLLEIVDVVRGDFLPSESTFFYLANQSEGWVYACSPWDTWPLSGVNGSGTLANVTFLCAGPGKCVLDLKETKLIDGSPIWVSTPPYLGDANSDMKVDFSDLGIMAFCIANQAYNSSADFNSDGYVDVYDLTCVFFNWAFLYPKDALQPVEIAHDVQDGYVNPGQVGGIVITIDKLAISARYIGLTLAILVSGIVTSLSIRHFKRKKEKQ